MTGDPTRSSNPLRDERAMFAVLLRVMGIAGVVLLLTAVFNSTVGAIAALFLVGLWIGIVVARRRGD